MKRCSIGADFRNEKALNCVAMLCIQLLRNSRAVMTSRRVGQSWLSGQKMMTRVNTTVRRHLRKTAPVRANENTTDINNSKLL